MKKEICELSKYRLSKAKDTFGEGLALFERDSFAGAVNRFYYAAFYAVRALLATKELDSSKHSGVISLFHKHFVKTNVVDVEKSKALSRSFEKRQDSDYEDFVSITKDEALLIKGRVKELIEECERALKKLGVI